MKLLVNTSNLYVGGGVQVAVSFIKELLVLKKDNIYKILISPVIKKELCEIVFPKNFDFIIIEKSPSSILTRSKIVKQLNDIENDYNPDIVFSVFGPSYWRPKNKHITGFADGWVYNQDSIAYERLDFFKRLKMRLMVQYKIYHLKHNSDYFILETKSAAQKLSKILNKAQNRFFVVGNTFSDIFNDKSYLVKKNKSYITLKKNKNDFFLMYIAHNHPAKNLSIINKVVPLLNDNSIKFVLTIDQKSYESIFIKQEIKSQVINLGPISLTSCPSVYSQCEALFAPTLLETFSAAYPEAMKMKKPILTSEFTFAKEVCEDAAIYFNPIDAQDIVEKIIKLKRDKGLAEELVFNGLQRMKEFETANSRANKYIVLFNKIIKEQDVQK